MLNTTTIKSTQISGKLLVILRCRVLLEYDLNTILKFGVDVQAELNLLKDRVDRI